MPQKTSRLSPEDWILAGFRALAQEGPEALKAEKLARNLGTTKGSFYWHFKDVQDFKARMLAYWHDEAYSAVTQAVEMKGSPAERLYRLTEIAATEDSRAGGVQAEPAIRAWARSDHTVSDAVREIDARRLSYTADLLAELGLTNPDFARILYGAYIGMGTLSAGDGTDNRGAMSSLVAALLALQEA